MDGTMRLIEGKAGMHGMIGATYRYSGVRAISVQGPQVSQIATIVDQEIRKLMRDFRAEVQVHYVPICVNGTTTSVMVMFHYGKNMSPF